PRRRFPDTYVDLTAFEPRSYLDFGCRHGLSVLAKAPAPTVFPATQSISRTKHPVSFPLRRTPPMGPIVKTAELSADFVFEYACHEGNYGLANLLSGARAAEGGTRALTEEGDE